MDWEGCCRVCGGGYLPILRYPCSVHPSRRGRCVWLGWWAISILESPAGPQSTRGSTRPHLLLTSHAPTRAAPPRPRIPTPVAVQLPGGRSERGYIKLPRPPPNPSHHTPRAPHPHPTMPHAVACTRDLGCRRVALGHLAHGHHRQPQRAPAHARRRCRAAQQARMALHDSGWKGEGGAGGGGQGYASDETGACTSCVRHHALAWVEGRGV